MATGATGRGDQPDPAAFPGPGMLEDNNVSNKMQLLLHGLQLLTAIP